MVIVSTKGMGTILYESNWAAYLFFSASKSFVKKKAALTLLRLYRKHPDVIPAVDWSERLIALLDESDLVINMFETMCKFFVF